MNDPEYTPNNQLDLPEQVHDFGSLLRGMRNNHGYSMQQMSKMVALPVDQISNIELSKTDLPPENILRIWLAKLGCGRNINKIILMSRNYRVKHWLMLQRNELCNTDILRLIDQYNHKKLTDYDRALLSLIAR